MNFLKLFTTNILLLTIISIGYILYASVFLKPLTFQHFSLVDDGQVLIQSSSYLEDCIFQQKCGKFLDQTFEFGTSRFRPSYWLINNFLYEAFGNNAQLHHTFRIYVVGYLLILLLSLVFLDLKIGWPMFVVGLLIFVTNYSFSENIIRLGTNEPFQVFFLAIFSLLYLRFREQKPTFPIIFPFLVILLIWTILIKENNIAILPVIVLTEYFYSKNNLGKALKLVAIPSAVFGLGVVLSKILPSTISLNIPVYTSNYVTNPQIILDNAVSNMQLLFNSMSPLLKLALFLSPLLIVIQRTRKLLKNEKFYYWLLFTGFFTLILFPWRYVLERYQLISIFGITVVITFVIHIFLKFVEENLFSRIQVIQIYKIAFEMLSFLVIINLFSRGLPVNLAKTINYRDWFSSFTLFEADQVRAIARFNDDKVYVNGVDNINNWELLYEVPIHLEFLYGLAPNIKNFDPSVDQMGYIFSRTSFDSVVEIDELARLGYKIVSFNSYHINQIDPLQFRDRFALRPLQTIEAPPLTETGYDYYWEVRRLEKK